jgi:alkanesulfonate monooxygenase SsuD/methylene tetrahydromethanopterin reductase-like flavin-dependent oxidoreductase (luciferase family)
MRAVLDHERPRFDSGYFEYDWSSPAFEHPPVEIGIGVLRQVLAAVAGQTADVAITWLTPLDYLSAVLLPAAESAAAQHGRTPPRFAAMVGVVLDRPGRDSVRMAFAGCEPHLTAPHYVDMLCTAGIAVDESRPDLGAERLVAEKVVLTGSVADVLAGIAEYWAAGIHEVILNVGGVRRLHGDEAALADLAELLGALPGVAGNLA